MKIIKLVFNETRSIESRVRVNPSFIPLPESRPVKRIRAAGPSGAEAGEAMDLSPRDEGAVGPELRERRPGLCVRIPFLSEDIASAWFSNFASTPRDVVRVGFASFIQRGSDVGWMP